MNNQPSSKQRPQFKAHHAYRGYLGEWVLGVPRFPDGTPNRRAQAYRMMNDLDKAAGIAIRRGEKGKRVNVFG